MNTVKSVSTIRLATLFYITAFMTAITSRLQSTADELAQSMGYKNFQAVPPMIKNAIYLMLALVVIGSLASAGFGAIFTTNTSGWQQATVSVYYVIPIAAAIAIALYFFNELR